MKLIAAAFFFLSTLLAGCESRSGDVEKPRLSMFVAVDISGSFTKSGYYDDGIQFLARYLYGHLNGLGGLEVPNALFVSSIGGLKAEEPKTFYPKQTFENKSVEEITRKLKELFPKPLENPYTDFNAYFEQIAIIVRNRKLVLRPVSIVMISDGIPDVRKGGRTDFRSIQLKPLEGLARNITIRVLYTNPEVGKGWQTKVRRSRVRIWTQDAPVMVQWKDPKIYLPDKSIEEQTRFFAWVADNVDYGVRGRRVD